MVLSFMENRLCGQIILHCRKRILQNLALLLRMNQSEIHYAMPVRNLIYDALNYGQQVNKISALHRKDKNVKNTAEYLSGFNKDDKIMPVITLTVYFGAKEWNAPRCLKDMFPDNIDAEIMEQVDDYRLHLIIPKEIKEFSAFKTDFGKAMKFIAASENPKELKKLSRDKNYEKVSVETVHLINECTGSNIAIPENEEMVNMCKGLEELGRERHDEGVWETLVALVQKGLLAVKDAAAQAGVTVEEFEQRMQKM